MLDSVNRAASTGAETGRDAAGRTRQPAPSGPASTVTAGLGRRVEGSVWRAGDDGYDAECAVLTVDEAHRPAVVVGATGPADVMAAVAFATDHGMPVAVRATGHGASLPASGAVLVSTRRMQGVRVDPFARVARVEAGVRCARLVHEAAAFGLAPLAGSSPDVGSVAYTLGGGLGVLGRAHGYAADHVRSVDIVTAHGMLRHVTADQYADLFWAVRGGKGNFGVVTALEVDLFPVTTLYGGGLYFRGGAAAAVLHAYRRWVRTVPEEMSSSCALNRYPMTDDVPAPLRGRFAVHVRVAYCGSAADGERLVRPLRTAGVPILDTVGELPFTDAGRIHDDPPLRTQTHERTAMLRELDEDAVDALLDVVGPDAACPLGFVELRHLGGALGRPPAVANAVGNRDAGFQLYVTGEAPAGHGEPLGRYAELVTARMAPWCTGGVALNFLGGDGDTAAARVRAAYAPGDLRRLERVKRAYDPENLFCVNHNIPPVRY
ncbi:MAG TPA: FAD-binding oxidoreductase [Mycobacteriales bacterium]|nr:FAD-binding oxidoreductase [Mycobacteriales bacterium]